jgi:drug/metabolite transporter (DMT)-like permease
LFWGSNFVFGAMLVKQFSPLLLSAFRLTFTALFFVVYALVTRRFRGITWGDVGIFIPLAVVGTVMNQSAFYMGLQTTSPTTAALVLSLTPITTAYLSFLFLKESLSKPMIGGSVVALVGVFLVIGAGDSGAGSGLHVTWGLALTFVAMLTFSISIIITRKLTTRMDPFTATMYSIWFGCLLQVPVAFTVEPLTGLSPEPWAWALAAASALVTQGICGLIWNRQIKEIGASKSAIFLNLQPFVAMVVGYLLLHTKVTMAQIFGSLLVIGGVIIASEVFRVRDTLVGSQQKRES